VTTTTPLLPHLLGVAPRPGAGAAASALLQKAGHLISELLGQVWLVIHSLQAHQRPPAGASAVFAVLAALLLVTAWKLRPRRGKS
jgi:hypothetical protein